MLHNHTPFYHGYQLSLKQIINNVFLRVRKLGHGADYHQLFEPLDGKLRGVVQVQPRFREY